MDQIKRVSSMFDMLDDLNAIHASCVAVALAYDKNRTISLDQIRHGSPTKENPHGNPIPKAHLDLIIKSKGLDTFAHVFCPMYKEATIKRLFVYISENNIQPKEFELKGPIWISWSKKSPTSVVFGG